MKPAAPTSPASPPRAATVMTSDRGGAAEPAVSCVDLWKQYYFYAHRPRKVKEVVFQFLSGTLPPQREPVWALQNFNLTVQRGETVGFIGHNGAGKSTLLKLLARILVPTRGSIHINGRLSAIIELGAGFHEDLTARENVFLAASFLGLRKREVMGLYDRIVDFSELGEHMETPVKYFSSGMHARLGFAIAINVDPDVLLIDEVLAVGDATFQPKCKDAIKRFQDLGKTILFVSHDLTSMRNICNRVVWLKNGQICGAGDANDTVDAYLEHYWPGSTAHRKKIPATA